MDTNNTFQTGSSGFPAPQSNNPFLHSSQGSVTAPTTGSTLSGASTSGSSYDSLNTASGSSLSGSSYGGINSTSASSRLGSASTTTDPLPVDQKAANDLGSNAAALGNSVMANLQSAANAVANNPTVQSINNGPLVQNVRNEASITQHEFQNLAASRTRPAYNTATGQQLTYYHSTFYSLLTWQNPRATAIIFASTIVFIFMTRYLNILSYIFKFAYFTLGITASLEIAGKLLFDNGLASRMRPRKYYTVSKDSLATSLDDIEQLVNFFVIEAQRVLFAENIYSTIGVFAAAVVSYLFMKLVPFWGLALLGTCVLYLGPLVYIKNREAIDSTVDQMEHVISAQATQLKDLTVDAANQATQTVKAYADDASHLAQEYIGSAKKTVANTTEDVKVAASNTAENVKASASNTADSVRSATNNAANNIAANTNTSRTTTSVGSTDSYAKTQSSLAAPRESLTGSTSSGSLSGSSTSPSTTFGSNPASTFGASTTVPISDFRTAAPPSSTTLGSNEFRPLSSNDFPAVPKRDSELVADSIKPRDSEVQPLLNH